MVQLRSHNRKSRSSTSSQLQLQFEAGLACIRTPPGKKKDTKSQEDAQLVKALAASLDHPSSIVGTHMIGGKNQLLQVAITHTNK